MTSSVCFRPNISTGDWGAWTSWPGVGPSWSVSLNHEWLGSEIADSPIVDKNSVWSGTVGIAYNNDIFRGRGYTGDTFGTPGF